MKRVGISYKQHPVEDHYDCIVIGSGIGGLATAALLSRHGGKKVLVLEKHGVAGGFTHAFHRPNYEWDVGVHYIGRVRDEKMDVRAAFDHITNGELKWQMMPDVYDRISIGSQDFNFPTGTEKFRQQMKAYFPSEAKGIDRYISAVESAAKLSGLYFAEKAIPSPVAKAIGGMLRYGFLRHAKKTTAQALAEYTKDPDLAAVLTGQWGDYGLPPEQSSFGMHSVIAHHYFEGAGFPIGGAPRIAESIAPTIERTGGCIAISAHVTEILVDQNNTAVGVRMADGREIRADSIVSDAGAINTFRNLLSTDIQQSIPETKLIHNIPPSISHLCLYVGLKHLPNNAEYGNANLWVYPDRNHDRNFYRFCQDIEAPIPALFISFPSAKDPTFASRHPGRATIEVATWASHGQFEKWQNMRWKHRGEEYETFKHKLAKRMLDELERLIPAVRGNVDYFELSTPLSTKHFTNHPTGEIYGLAHTPERFCARWLGSRTSIRNLLLTGQDVTTGGVTGAMFGGVVSASLLLNRNMMAVVTR